METFLGAAVAAFERQMGPEDPPGRIDEPPTRGSDLVLRALRSVGVELVVGLPGTQTLPIDRAVQQASDVQYVMARHETAIPHIAWGYYEAVGRPAATVTVPGPGDTNAMHGLKNALEDNVPILHVSADVDPADRGKSPIHEIDPATYDSVVKRNVNVTRPVELTQKVAAGVQAAMTPPTGPVRLGIPAPFFDRDIRGPQLPVEPPEPDRPEAGPLERAGTALAGAERPVVVVGGGARRSPDAGAAIATLVERLNAHVLATYKGKGVFPEDEARFVGVTGGHLPAGPRQILAQADVVLALGTDFDGVGTDHWELPMGETLIHVTLSLDDIDQGYPPDIPVLGDLGRWCNALLDTLPTAIAPGWDGRQLGRAVREDWQERLAERGLYDPAPPLSTAQTLTTIRRVLPREAIVTTDIGGFRLWTLQAFPTYGPDTFITAGSWAGMGIGLPSALGAALGAADRPVVGLTGDGGLLMCLQELHTIVEEGLAPTLVVGNNEDYGVISNAPGQDAPDFSWEGPDFGTIADGFGWEQRTVATPTALAGALSWALDVDRPVLIDAQLDPDEPTVFECATYEPGVDLVEDLGSA